MDIKAIIWDWSRTLYDSDNQTEFQAAEDILKYCQDKGYRLALISLVTPDGAVPDLVKRDEEIERSPLKKYFEIIKTVASRESSSNSNVLEKDLLFKEIASQLNLRPEEILIVDDRTIRGIKYANQHGHPSIWLQQGKFASELPNAATGQPTYTVKSLEEIKNIL
jgi:FMN phosphatase YigB (HAD superfamily)